MSSTATKPQALNTRRIDAMLLSGKRVFIPLDFDVPQSKEDPNIITDTQHMDAVLPTIKYALEQGARSVVLATYLGRPGGSAAERHTLEPMAKVLQEKLGKPVTFLENFVCPELQQAFASSAPGSVILLDIRYHAKEEGEAVDKDGNKIKGTDELEQSLAKLADSCVGDAVGTAHRPHSATLGEGCSVRLSDLLAVQGCAKLSDMFQLTTNLLDKMNAAILGGGMASTFNKMLTSVSFGFSPYDEEMDKAKPKGADLFRPVDFVGSSELVDGNEIKAVTVASGPEGFTGLDCGPESITRIAKSKTTCAKHGTEETVTHCGTGGGASLGLLEGKVVPGISAAKVSSKGAVARARKVDDSRGNPTVKVDLCTEIALVREAVPRSASTGICGPPEPERHSGQTSRLRGKGVNLLSKLVLTWFVTTATTVAAQDQGNQGNLTTWINTTNVSITYSGQVLESNGYEAWSVEYALKRYQEFGRSLCRLPAFAFGSTSGSAPARVLAGLALFLVATVAVVRRRGRRSVGEPWRRVSVEQAHDRAKESDRLLTAA